MNKVMAGLLRKCPGRWLYKKKFINKQTKNVQRNQTA